MTEQQQEKGSCLHPDGKLTWEQRFKQRDPNGYYEYLRAARSRTRARNGMPPYTTRRGPRHALPQRTVPDPEIARWLRLSPDLSDREMQVASLAVRGADQAEIAAELGLAWQTVRHHMSAILRLVGVRSRTALACAYWQGMDAVHPSATTDTSTRPPWMRSAS